jgi:hypothetical protein
MFQNLAKNHQITIVLVIVDKNVIIKYMCIKKGIYNTKWERKGCYYTINNLLQMLNSVIF